MSDSAGETPAAPPEPVDGWRIQCLRTLADLTAARAEIAGKRDECELLRTQVASQHKIADERLAANFKQGAEIARLTEERDDHSQCHDTACNGSRQKPRGAKGVCCSCRGRDLAYQQAEAAEASLLALRAALNAIASWSEGPTVNSSFDEPESARIARAALAASPPHPETEGQ